MRALFLALVAAGAAVATVSSSSEASFPPIFIVNLERDVDRLAATRASLLRAGVLGHATRLPAVHGASLAPQQLRADATRLGRTFATRGMLGCHLSHRAFWERVAAAPGGDDLAVCAIVLEDDVEVSRTFARDVRAVLAALPAARAAATGGGRDARDDGWDVCLLGAIGMCHPRKRHGMNWLFGSYMLGWRPDAWRRRRAPPPSPATGADNAAAAGAAAAEVYRPLRPAGTHAYLLSRRGARKLLVALPKAQWHVDLVAWRLRRLELFACEPFLARPRFDEASTLIEPRAAAAAAPPLPTGKMQKKRGGWRRPLALSADAHTGQQWGHIFGEPLVRLPGLGVLTCGRQVVLMALGVVARLALSERGRGGRALAAGALAVTLAVRALIGVLVCSSVQPAPPLPAARRLDGSKEA